MTDATGNMNSKSRNSHHNEIRMHRQENCDFVLIRTKNHLLSVHIYINTSYNMPTPMIKLSMHSSSGTVT